MVELALAMENMLLDTLETQLIAKMITEVDPDDPTKVSLVRPGKLQDDPTKEEGLNILIIAPNEEFPIVLYADNVQSGLKAPTWDTGSATYMHPYKLYFNFHFAGEKLREVARTKALIITARARKALQDIVLPTHPDTGSPTDDFGETVIQLQVTKIWIREGGGVGHFIWRGYAEFGFLTEQFTRSYDEDD